jgi:hypothetical protein
VEKLKDAAKETPAPAPKEVPQAAPKESKSKS